MRAGNNLLIFQSKGWNVIAAMRNPEKETELNQLENVTLMPLDVNNVQQIEETVQAATRLQSIDVVFNNAGFGLSGFGNPQSDNTAWMQRPHFPMPIIGSLLAGA